MRPIWLSDIFLFLVSTPHSHLPHYSAHIEKVKEYCSIVKTFCLVNMAFIGCACILHFVTYYLSM